MNSAAASHPLFAWAGWEVPVGRAWRLLHAQGDARTGLAKLGDERRVCLELAWARVRRGNPDLRRLARRRFPGTNCQIVEHPSLHPLLMHHDEAAGLWRCLGFDPVTRRVLDFRCHPGSAREDLDFQRVILPALRDQGTVEPQRWAFLDVRFITPAGFGLRDCDLRVGDLAVELTAARGERLLVRHIYPAALALARQDLSAWRADLWRQHAPAYRVQDEERAQQPRPWRWLAWFGPSAAALRLVHDADRNRLAVLLAMAEPSRLDELMRQLADGLNWSDDHGS